MMNNTTSILNSHTTLNNDSIGAIIFIIFVLVWYSLSIVFLMGMRIGTSNEIFDDSIKHRSKLFAQSLRDQNNNNEILSKKNCYDEFFVLNI
jgi:membrane-anchored glycerophosphoryl diester phosphodiesterase (GDPDase)